MRDSRSFHSHEEDTREGHDQYVKHVNDDLRYGNAREQDYSNNRAHNIPNNDNMEHNPGGGSYSSDYYEGAKGGPGRFDQFNDEFDGNYNPEREEPRGIRRKRKRDEGRQ